MSRKVNHHAGRACKNIGLCYSVPLTHVEQTEVVLSGDQDKLEAGLVDLEVQVPSDLIERIKDEARRTGSTESMSQVVNTGLKAWIILSQGDYLDGSRFYIGKEEHPKWWSPRRWLGRIGFGPRVTLEKCFSLDHE